MKLLITGGLGFIGSSAAKYFSKNGFEVHVLDNLSRKGCEYNIPILKNNGVVNIIFGDIRDKNTIEKIIKNGEYSHILHLAAQVAVTQSLVDPEYDFSTNALGTFYIINSIKSYSPQTKLIFSSTNKVYGNLENYLYSENESRYRFESRKQTIDEEQSLDFHSPYGCSKGSADQYVCDYSKIYNLNFVTLRQSCIYGEGQYGIEDQGWVAWFLIAANLSKNITVYGNGKQVRDILHVNDLIKLYHLIFLKMNHEKITGAFNVGGGYSNSLSILELIKYIRNNINNKINFDFEDWRKGDQKIFISDNSKLNSILGWEPTVSVSDGLEGLNSWIKLNLNLINSIIQ